MLEPAELKEFRRARKVVEKVYLEDPTRDLNIGWHDINSDGIPDVFVMDYNPQVCGTGGCGFGILVSHGKARWQPMLETQLRYPPCILPTRYNGYNDLALAVERYGKRTGGRGQ